MTAAKEEDGEGGTVAGLAMLCGCSEIPALEAAVEGVDYISHVGCI